MTTLLWWRTKTPPVAIAARWKPLGKAQSYSNEELKYAPQFNPETLYASDTLIRFNGVNYISQSKVQKVSPLTATRGVFCLTGPEPKNV